MALTEPEKADRDRRLRLLRSAAASAIYNWASVDEAQAAFEEGVAEALANASYQAQQERLAARSR